MARRGQPTKYREEFCEALIENMKKGQPFEAFGAIAQVSTRTLYTWLEVHPEFLQARKEGEGYLIQHYVNMGQMIATGQLRRVKSERVKTEVDAKGVERIVRDGNGNPVYDRTYEPTTGNSTAWIFLCKNILNWRDVRTIGGDPDNPIKLKNVAQDPKDKLKEMIEMQKILNELGDGKLDTIEIKD